MAGLSHRYICRHCNEKFKYKCNYMAHVRKCLKCLKPLDSEKKDI